MIYLVYSDKYLDYSFGKGHPFWPERAKEFLELLQFKSKFNFKSVEAPRVVEEDILLVHTGEYLEKVKKMAKAGGGVSIDTPVTPENLEAAYYYTGGTLKAAELAMEGKKVVNLLGGLHHAESNDSSGFCIFNDHAITIRKMQQAKRIKKAAVLDLDVHAGNGTQEIFYKDPDVLTVSIHQDPTRFYPGTGFPWQIGEKEGEGYNKNYVLTPGVGSQEYLEILDQAVNDVERYSSDIVFVVLGVDTYKNDPLASINLDKDTYSEIAKKLRKFNKKVILFAGGYSKEVPVLWWEFVSNL